MKKTQLNNNEIKKLNKIIEEVKTINDSPVCILCHKENAKDFEEFLKGCKAIALPENDRADKNIIWIIPEG